MEKSKLPEVWLRGPLPDISPALQPVAHALLQAQEEIKQVTAGFPSDLLWINPAGAASVAFHLQHIRGVLDRLFTYAKGEALSPEQMNALKSEGKRPEVDISIGMLLGQLDSQIDKTIQELKTIDENSLFQKRNVGRAQLPSTVIGLLCHSAEHTMRHLGQLLVTVKVLQEKGSQQSVD